MTLEVEIFLAGLADYFDQAAQEKWVIPPEHFQSIAAELRKVLMVNDGEGTLLAELERWWVQAGCKAAEK